MEPENNTANLRISRFRDVFWDAFHRPKLVTPIFMEKWEVLEPINEQISGPLFSIYENGNCDYFFKDKNRFPWMNLPEDFLAWFHDRINKYKEEVELIDAVSNEEMHDKEILLFQVDIKMELVELAYDIQVDRLFK